MTKDEEGALDNERDVSHIITKDVHIEGDVRIGKNVIVHPLVRIVQEGEGYISIGDNTIIEECTHIVNRTSIPMTIQENCLIKSSCRFYGSFLGSCSILSPRVTVYGKASIGRGCLVGPNQIILKDEVLEDGTILHGTVIRRRSPQELQEAEIAHERLHQKHVLYLKDVLSKYHHLKE